MTFGHHGLRSAHTKIEPAAQGSSQQGSLLGEVYRCIKRHYTAIAVPTWRMLVSACREPAKVNADGLTPKGTN
jgi:hypothetical protein